jgi:hypothetical protein
MRTFGKFLFLIHALATLHCSAQGLTSFTTFGQPGNIYNTSAGWLVNGSANPPQPFVGEAFAFTATASGYLSQLSLAVAGNGNPATSLANITIARNSGANLPGTTLERFLNVSCPGRIGLNNPITSLASSVNPFLQSGSIYWLYVEAATPTSSVTVYQNSLGLLAPQAQEFSPSGWIAKGNKTTFAFAVEVTPVPEPSTIALAAFGIPFLIRPLVRRFYQFLQAAHMKA